MIEIIYKLVRLHLSADDIHCYTLGNVIFLMSRYVLYYGSQFEISQKMMLIFIGGLEKSKACEQFT